MDKPSTPDADKDIHRIFEIWENCRNDFKKDGEFLFGKFSIADAMFAPVVFRINSYGIPLTGQAKTYFTTMLAVPAMKEWREAAAKEKV
jgi:glutathione S-transferase